MDMTLTFEWVDVLILDKRVQIFLGWWVGKNSWLENLLSWLILKWKLSIILIGKILWF